MNVSGLESLQDKRIHFNNTKTQTIMKKIAQTLGMALMAALLMVGTPAEAQTSQQKKDAKNEAKRLQKEGFMTMGLPIQRQLEDFYTKVSERDDEGMPMYLMATNQAVGNSYAAAQMEATNIAKVRLAGQVQTMVMSQAKADLANASLNAEEAASITKVLEKSTLMVAQKLNRVIMAQEYYRVLQNKNYEVHVVLLYSSKAVREMVLQDAKKLLQEELDNFTPEHEKILAGICNNGIK